MVGWSLAGAAYHHQTLSIRTSSETSDNMSHRSVYGPAYYGQNTVRGTNVNNSNSSSSRSGSNGYPFGTLRPANAVIRRSSMSVQDMLNPSDEEPRRSPQSRSSPSSDNERRVPSSYRGGRSRRGNTSHGPSGHGSHRASRQPSRRASPSSSGSESGEAPPREARKAYTLEEAHFIWYVLSEVKLYSITSTSEKSVSQPIVYLQKKR